MVGVMAAFNMHLRLFVNRAPKPHARQRQDVHEKGLDKSESKPELTVSMPAKSRPYIPYNKPEFSARKNTINEPN